MKKLLSVCAILVASQISRSQNLPSEYRIDTEAHQIKVGGDTWTGLYKQDEMKTIYLEFSQSNWWTLLTQNYSSQTDIAATMTVDGVTYEQVGVGFKGQTSYSMVQGEKKSFSIKTDAFIDGQSCQGYKTFNLNNCFDDASFMREFLYLHMICKHVPAAKAAFVKLVINGENWGVYPSVQQMNGDYLKEWFMSNDGALWRADAPSGTGGGGPGGGGGGPQWGDGTAALNYLSADTADYQDYYTLKSTGIADPWTQLVNTCDVLENTSIANLSSELPAVMDVDRALWFLACENAFGDDDSYIYKGKMDYYNYWEAETGRLTPLEYDGNSVLVNESANWGVFYHADNANYPLLNRLMQVAEYRQRYLAHMRTVVAELLDDAMITEFIDYYYNLIDAEVQADDKKLYSYSQFQAGPNDLNTRIDNRRTLLSNNTEMNTVGASISSVIMTCAAGEWGVPNENEIVHVTASVSSPDGLSAVYLYYSSEIVGNFTKVTMLDDGANNDGAAGDGVFGASIPGQIMGTLVRFYVEAVEANTAQTRSYLPVGAEHDVFYYQITAQFAASTDVVINEMMASNNTTMADEAGEFDDWIELYNRGNSTVDLSGWHLTDNTSNIDKWSLPDGTSLGANQYMIVWADEDSSQGPLHANFKLSASAEVISLVNSSNFIADQVSYEQLVTDQGYARVPNGWGSFILQDPTFNSNNDVISVSETDAIEVSVYPNPARDLVYIRSSASEIAQIRLMDMHGQLVYDGNTTGSLSMLDTSNFSSGVYVLTLTNSTQRITQRLMIQR